LFDPAAGDDAKTAAIAAIARRLDFVAQSLQGRDYLVGNRFTVADGYLFTVLGWAGYVKMSLADWPVLQAYVERIGARPAVQQAMRNEGLIK
jgi:glutathione S-transferase